MERIWHRFRVDLKRSFLICFVRKTNGGKPWPSDLPPLNALRCFDIAAKHLSFTKAAAELNVTHSAVSHQIKALEEWLGVPLFRRVNRGLVLTEAGPGLSEAGARSLRAPGRGHPAPQGARAQRAADRQRHALLRRQMAGAAAAAAFASAIPTSTCASRPSPELVDFEREDVDIAVRYGRGNWPGLKVELLMHESMFPVCSPRLLEGPAAIRKPGDIAPPHAAQRLDWRMDVWQLWLEAAGLGAIECAKPRSASTIRT